MTLLPRDGLRNVWPICFSSLGFKFHFILINILMELNNQVNAVVGTFIQSFSVIFSCRESVWTVRLRGGCTRINTSFARPELILGAVTEGTLRERMLGFQLPRNSKPCLAGLACEWIPRLVQEVIRRMHPVPFLPALPLLPYPRHWYSLQYSSNVVACSLYPVKWAYPVTRKLLLNFKTCGVPLPPSFQWLHIPVLTLCQFLHLYNLAPGSLLSPGLSCCSSMSPLAFPLLLECACLMPHKTWVCCPLFLEHFLLPVPEP